MKRIIAILAVAAFAGCGTSEDEQQIRAALDAQERTVAVTAEPTVADDPAFGVSEAEAVRVSEVEAVEVDGDTAEARYDDGFAVRLRRDDGRWIVDDEKVEVLATLEAEGRAWKAMDWDAACALRTEAARRDFCPEERDDGMDVTLGNEPIVTFNFTRRGPPRVAVEGDRATVRYEGGSVTRLRKVGGRWLIDR